MLDCKTMVASMVNALIMFLVCVEVCEILPLGKSLSVRLACFLLILYIVSIKPYSKTDIV